MATACFGVAAVAVLAVDFTALATVALTACLAATVFELDAPTEDFTAVAAFALFAGAAGDFAGFFIAFAIESTAN
ncbi:hypothetical protein [Herbaspirillum sp. alder98]|uniref:hypothetical protein n=1 Tax=Herbaspirillum sp. alder98 TaxID=2913096 RepID=UPI001CD878A8|nr:hypothetical protein [Herbaspirillum sp. alder98]MCA1325112.1 hypothetical protein [Herbaspirillum sp. alder98]